MDNGKVDRISALPDSIIHCVFSYLDTRQVVQTSLLSHRWRYLWTSTPYLNFHLQLFPSDEFAFHQPSTQITLKRDRFINFVDQVLILRDAFSIHKFSLYSDEEIDAGHVYEWLIAASRQHVQELCLHISIDEPLELPHSLFTSSLTILEFSHHCSIVPIQMPQSMCSATRIKILQLERVKLPDGNVDGELILSCPVLEILILFECDHKHLKKLTISAMLLKRLDLYALNWETVASCAIAICSPNLASLKLSVCMYRDCSFVDLSGLDSAHVNTYGDMRMEKELYDKCLINVIKGISNVKALTISASVLKTIADSPYMLDLLPNLCHNLRCMKLVDWTVHICIQEVTSFLGRLCHIETFVWSRNPKEMELGSRNEGVDETNSSLRTIEIHNSLGSEDELNLLKILLKKCIVLNQIIIMTNESLAQDRNKLGKFHKKLSKLPRASSQVRISYRLSC